MGTKLGNLLAELKRRHIYRAGAAYAVAAFALIEIVSNVAPMFDLPAWIGRGVVLLLILGFPVTLLVVWLRELPPADGAAARAVTGKLDFVLIGALVAVVGFMAYDRFAPAPGATTAQEAGGPNTGMISIAVLPFVNLSSDKEQEYFSDGMTEEITSALAKVKDLQVVGRTSAFEFKGQNKDLRAIGAALGATNILEGSVRKEGNQIRVTAQLIRADTGRHIWTDNYDRELKSVFAIQDEIAQAIAAALQVPLGLKPGETLVASRAIDPENYQAYLRAKALYRARGNGEKPLTAAIALLEPLVAREPDYAPAWALLALTYSNAPQENPTGLEGEERRRVNDSYLTKAEAAGRRAIELAPNSADAYAGAANSRVFNGRELEAIALYRQALKIDPFNPDALHGLSQQLVWLGPLNEAHAMRLQVFSLDPLVPQFTNDYARLLDLEGQPEAALAIYKSLPSTRLTRAGYIAQVYASMGRYAEAADAILSAPAGEFSPGVAEAAVRLLRQAPATVTPQDLPDLPNGLSFVYIHVGATDRWVKAELDALQSSIDAGYRSGGSTIRLHMPWAAPARKTERFKELMRRSGAVDYWRANGWSGSCRPTTGDDFVCE